jgi:hypothetical protein
VLSFIVARTFQEFAYWFWVPTSHDPQEALLIYLPRVDQVRALLMMGTILFLIVPHAVIVSSVEYSLLTLGECIGGFRFNRD